METMSRDTGHPLAFSPFAVASIVASMTLVAIANGLMFAYVPIRLGSAGYDPVWAGSIVTALSAGGMVGCLAAAPVVRRIGHPRAYMALTAIIIASNTLVPFAVVFFQAEDGIRDKAT